jgi:hypothetical protein
MENAKAPQEGKDQDKNPIAHSQGKREEDKE